MMGNETAIIAGIELVKMLLMLAMQEARRANLTPEQLELAFSESLAQFNANDPNKIPEV
jgi:hypothetical protein